MFRIGLIVASMTLAIDHASKWLLMGLLQSSGSLIQVLPNFNLVMVWNPGVSFGLFQSDRVWVQWVLISIAVVVVIFLLNWLRKAETRITAVALGLIVGGAVGNVIDRVLWGAVADFFDVYIGRWHWPAFNVADSAIVVGAVLMIFDGLFANRGQDK